jgi:KaiC/GvpD/RAD55 family RecA-like ATPase
MTVTIYHNESVDAIDDLVGSPALDRPIAVTRFPTIAATRKKTMNVTLRQLAAEIVAEEATDKARLPGFKLATFGNDKTLSPSGHSYRTNANMQAVSGLEADYDGGEITPEDACDVLLRAGLSGIVYTTPSHSPDAPRWRVFTPFEEERPPVERAQTMARLNGLFDGKLDGSSFTPSQFFYGGNVTGRPKVKAYLVEGRRYVDTADDLDATARGKHGREKGVANDNTTDEAGLLEAIASGAVYHTSTTALAGKWASAGVPMGDAIQRIWQAFMRVEKRDSRWHDRVAVLPNTVAAIYEYQAAEDRAEDDRRNAILDDVAWEQWVEGFISIPPDPAIQADIDELVGNPQSEDHEYGLSFMTPSQCDLNRTRRYVIKGLVSEGDVACIVGAPGVGKSLLAPRIAYAVAQGQDIFGMRVRQGCVMYVAAEDHHGMAARVRALYQQHGDAKEFALVGGVSDLLSKSSMDLKRLKRAAQDRTPSLIVIDTLAMAFPGLEENSAEGMGRVVEVARSLTKWGAAVILIHHDTKDGQQGLPRGHSLLNGALDVSLHLTRKMDGVVKATLTKNRSGTTERDIAFTIGTRTVGMDEDGEPITAAICQELAPGDAPERNDRLPPSANAAHIIFLKLIGDGDSVSEGEFRKACVDDRTVSAAEDPDSRRKAYKRAVEELTRLRKVEFSDGRFMRPNSYREVFNDE